MFERLSVVRLLFWTVQNSRNHWHICRAQWLNLWGIRLEIVNSEPADSVCCATMTAVFSTSNNIFFPNHTPSWAETWWEASRQNGEPELLKSFHSDIKDSHSLNSHLGILQTVSSSNPYVFLSIKKATWRLRINKNLFIKISKMTKD